DTTGLSVKVDPPPFVRILDTALGTQTYGQAGTKIYCDVSFAVDTRRTGEFADNILVSVAGQQTKVPVKAKVSAKEPGLTRILLVETPIERFSTNDANHFTAWLDLVKTAKLDVHYLVVKSPGNVLRELDLTNFDVVLLAAGGLVQLNEHDRNRLKKF